MGHLFFLLLHAAALLFFGVGFLFLTVPLHLIYGALRSRGFGRPAADGAQVRCPACRELVRADASKCKHCGSALIPAAAPVKPQHEKYDIAIAIGAIVLIGVIAKACGG